VLFVYSGAVDEWKAGLELFASDREKANARLLAGDKLHEQAVDEFNVSFGGQGKKGSRR